MSIILMKIGRRTYLVNMHKCAKNGASRSSRLFAVHNRTFRDSCTHAQGSTDKQRVGSDSDADSDSDTDVQDSDVIVDSETDEGDGSILLRNVNWGQVSGQLPSVEDIVLPVDMADVGNAQGGADQLFTDGTGDGLRLEGRLAGAEEVRRYFSRRRTTVVELFSII